MRAFLWLGVLLISVSAYAWEGEGANFNGSVIYNCQSSAHCQGTIVGTLDGIEATLECGTDGCECRIFEGESRCVIKEYAYEFGSCWQGTDCQCNDFSWHCGADPDYDPARIDRTDGNTCYVQDCNISSNCGPLDICFGEVGDINYGYCLPGDPCSDENPCPEGQQCAGGVCENECSAENPCPEGQICRNGVCGNECSDEYPCPVGQECLNGVCQEGCSEEVICPSGEECRNGICLGGCTENADCGEGQECRDGGCYDQVEEVCDTCDVACPEGYWPDYQTDPPRCILNNCDESGMRCTGDDPCVQGTDGSYCEDAPADEENPGDNTPDDGTPDDGTPDDGEDDGENPDGTDEPCDPDFDLECDPESQAGRDRGQNEAGDLLDGENSSSKGCHQIPTQTIPLVFLGLALILFALRIVWRLKKN